MALAQRIESLRKRHTHIEGQLQYEKARPARDMELIQQLKREKLLLKDEISRLCVEEQSAAA